MCVVGVLGAGADCADLGSGGAEAVDGDADLDSGGVVDEIRCYILWCGTLSLRV